MSQSLTFVTMGGEPISGDFSNSDGRVASARAILSTGFKARPAFVRFMLPDGKVLEDSDMLPSEGTIQVALSNMAEGKWANMLNKADVAIDEGSLREALKLTWPGDYIDDGKPVQDVYGGEPVTDPDRKFYIWRSQAAKILEDAVVKELGEWANYRKFAQSGDSYGYFMLAPPNADFDSSADQVIADVKKWQGLLLDLEQEFSKLRERTTNMVSSDAIEVVAAQLLRFSPSYDGVKTSFKYGFETWYAPFITVLHWYVSSAGLEPNLPEVIEEAVYNGFRSYTVRPDGATFLAQAVGNALKLPYDAVDSTASWFLHRGNLLVDATFAPRVSDEKLADAHFQFIETWDCRRDANRAEGMRAALAKCRKDASGGEPLTFALLQSWHMHVLQLEAYPNFRKHDAFAKQGRERYPIKDGLQETFSGCLAEAMSSEPAPLRAARAYLDVCFVHPFNDGNGRLARLVLEFILVQAGLCLIEVEPVFVMPRRADDAAGSQAFLELVAKLTVTKQPGVHAVLDTWAKEHANLIEAVPAEYNGLEVVSKTGWFNCNTSVPGS